MEEPVQGGAGFPDRVKRPPLCNLCRLEVREGTSVHGLRERSCRFRRDHRDASRLFHNLLLASHSSRKTRA